MKKPAGVYLAATVFIGVVGLFMLLPSVLVIIMSFGKADLLRFPPELFSLRWYEEFLGSEPWTSAALRSVAVGLGAASLAAVLGTAAAVALVRGRLPHRRALALLMISPMIVPPIVLAVGGYGIFVRLGFEGSLAGLAVVHAVFAVPFVMLLVTAALYRTDASIETASASLGASTWTTYRRITLPLIAPAIITGGLFGFLYSFDELVLALFLVGTDAPTLPIKVFSGIMFGLSPIIAAVATVLLLVTSVLLGSAGRIRQQADRAIRGTTMEEGTAGG